MATNNTVTSWVDVPSDPSAPSATLISQTTAPVASSVPPKLAVDYLVAEGVDAADAMVVVEALGATTVDDLQLVDEDMATEAVQTLKLIPRKVARTALLSSSAFSSTQDARDAGATTNSETKTASEEKTNTNTVECVAICIDHSGSMGTGFDETKSWNDDGNANALNKVLDNRSRMDAVKQVFYAFRDRTETLQATHELGLIQFDSEVETLLPLTSSLDLFESIVDDVEKRGMTSIYSAIREACAMLRPRFDAAANGVDLRVLLLTDGQSNSGASPEAALASCNEIGATVDCIIVGDTPDENLRKIVKLTGGSCFQIRSLSEGFELMESEAVVSLKSRRGGNDRPEFMRREMPSGGFATVQAQAITSGRNASNVAVRRTVKAVKPMSCGALFSGGTVPKATRSSNAQTTRRIMKELSLVAKGSSAAWMHTGEGVHIFPDADDIHSMKVLLAGPTNTPFAGGTFALQMTLPSNYPYSPPRLHFETPIYHCNVSGSGQICLDVLHSGWSPTLSLSKVCEAVRIMMIHADTDNALRQWIAELTLMHRQSGGADTRYFDAASAATKKDASRSIDEWKALWGIA